MNMHTLYSSSHPCADVRKIFHTPSSLKHIFQNFLKIGKKVNVHGRSHTSRTKKEVFRSHKYGGGGARAPLKKHITKFKIDWFAGTERYEVTLWDEV